MSDFYFFIIFLLCITTFISFTIIMQVQVSNKKLVQRYDHSAAPLDISPECLEVILFGGRLEIRGISIADTVALRFGEDYKSDYEYNYVVT